MNTAQHQKALNKALARKTIAGVRVIERESRDAPSSIMLNLKSGETVLIAVLEVRPATTVIVEVDGDQIVSM